MPCTEFSEEPNSFLKEQIIGYKKKLRIIRQNILKEIIGKSP
jgi:hypothetical protein